MIIKKLKRCLYIFRFTDLRKNLSSLLMLFCFYQSSSKLRQKLGLEKRTNQIIYILCLFWDFGILAVPHKKASKNKISIHYTKFPVEPVQLFDLLVFGAETDGPHGNIYLASQAISLTIYRISSKIKTCQSQILDAYLTD